MESSDNRYQDADVSRVAKRTMSQKRVLSPHLGPIPPSAPIRITGGRIRQAQRVCSDRSSNTSSVYLDGAGPSLPKTGIYTVDDPVMTITSAASVNRRHVQKLVTEDGNERIMKLEDGLKNCLSRPYPRRVVSDTFAGRATRTGRVIDESGREEHEVNERRNQAKRVEKMNGDRKAEAKVDLGGRDGRGKERGVDEMIVGGARRAISLRAESRSQWSVGDGIGIRRLSWLGRRKLVEWGMGVYPRIVYASDSSSGSEDGLGGRLTGTVLCRMGSKHRVWDVVQKGQKFVVRVVGSFMGDAEDVIVYSMMGNGKSRVHSKRTGSGFVSVGDHVGRICDEGVGDVVTVCVGITGGGRDVVAGEIRWRLGDDEGDTRSGAVLLRFGYYFFLKEATGVRLFTTTHTPEHVRLVARRVADGSIDDNFSSSLTYIIVRVAAD